MSIITKKIVNADAEVRYLTPKELEQINVFIKSCGCIIRSTQC